jgi:tRNA threonylcarbamoyladenosine biosynthesis protein TsaB
MKALILETSTQKSFILLAEDGKPKKSKQLSGGSELSRTLASEVKMLLHGETVDWILVGQGPGSYTGIRVGAALAKGLSFGWNIPLYGFHSLKAFIPPENGTFAILVDARMGGTYVLLGHRQNECIKTDLPILVKLEELEPLLQDRKIIVSPTPSDILKRTTFSTLKEADPYFDQLAAQAFYPEFQTPLELTYLRELQN